MFNMFLRIFLFFLVAQPFSVHPRTLRSTSVQSQHLFQNLEAIDQKGNETIAVSEAKTYLKAFGYLESKADFNNKLLKADDDEFDEDLETAIKKFQEYYNLNVSGKLDSDTIKLMSLPRCGVPDHHHHDTNIIGNYSNVKLTSNSKYAYHEGHYKWPDSKRSLTYIFASGVEVYPLDVMRNVFKEAFEQWSNVTSFTFNETAELGEVDLIIGFFRGDHGDGAPFQRVGYDLGHAFFPTDGRLHLNADQPWSTQVPIQHGNYDLVWVAMHEIGHLLGLDHSSHHSAVMYPFVHRGVKRRALSKDDIAGIRSLYSLPGVAYSHALHCDYYLMMFAFACSLIIFLFL